MKFVGAVTVVSTIARGGFGRVEKVRTADRRLLARKVFDPAPELGLRDTRELDKVRKRFEREVRVQMAFAKYGIMPILEADLTSDPPSYIMPLADKNYTQQILEDREAGTISSAPLLEILNGLEELHRLRYVHRDLKPDNVLLHEGAWKLSDFGLVSELNTGVTTRLTSTASIWGTQLYMAPEQTKDFHHVTPAADIYAFGCIIHDLVDGGIRIPFAAHTVKGPFDAIVRKCTAIDPKRRFQNVAGLRAALVAVLKRGATLERSEQTREWSKALEGIESWTDERAAALAGHLAEARPGDEAAVIAEISEEQLAALAERFPDEWDRIALAYCDWSMGSFVYEFCDVLIGRLEAVFRAPRSSLDVRAAALMAAARLGRAHNRWFVMGRVMRMADDTLEEDLAERIAIEIQANDAADDFLKCAKHITRTIQGYHPRIVEVLQLSDGGLRSE